MKLVIIRRPETNKDTHSSGEPEAPSPQGKDQLAQITTICREENVQAIIHSPQPRAAVAAATLAQTLHVPAIVQQELQERDFGDWDEWEWSRIAAKLNKLTIEERYTFVPPNGESWQQMEERLRAALQHIATLGYASAALITHWGSIRALLPILRNEPRESTLKLEVANGQVFIESL